MAMSTSDVLGEDCLDGRRDELTGAFDGAFVCREQKELLEDEVREAALRRRVGRGLGDSLDRGVLIALRAGLEVRQTRRGE